MQMQAPAESAKGEPRKPFYRILYVQVLIGLALGVLTGHFWPEFGAALKPFGDGFVKLVKMMIAPIVFCTIVSGINSISDSREVGRTLVKSMALFYLLTVLALLAGLIAVSLIQPGAGMHVSVNTLDPSVAAKFSKQAAATGFADFMLHIIPHSFFGAFADGEVLPVLLVSILIAFGLSAFLSPPLHPSTPQSPNSRPAKPGLARTGTITGTLRYASISCMNKGPPSRRDDLESLLYTLVYLGRGTLPWKELGEVARLGGEGDRPRGGETNGKFERTKKMKEATSSKSLCGNLPECFRVFADYAKELSVEEVPAYGLLRQLFANEAKRLGFDLKRKDAWDFFRKKKSRRTFEKEKAEKGKNWECRGPCFALIERKNHYEFFEKKENRKPVEANIL